MFNYIIIRHQQEIYIQLGGKYKRKKTKLKENLRKQVIISMVLNLKYYGKFLKMSFQEIKIK